MRVMHWTLILLTRMMPGLFGYQSFITARLRTSRFHMYHPGGNDLFGMASVFFVPYSWPDETCDTIRFNGVAKWQTLALVSFLIKAALAFNTFGTNDVLMFQESFEKAERVPGIQMYEHKTVRLDYEGKKLWDELFNHPPSMISF